MSQGDGERRRYDRVRVRLPGFVSVQAPTRTEPIEVMDLSEGGSLVRCDEELAEGTAVHLTFEQGSSEGRVVWTDEELPGFGIEFDEPDTGIRTFVRKLLEVCDDLHRRNFGNDDDSDDPAD